MIEQKTTTTSTSTTVEVEKRALKTLISLEKGTLKSLGGFKSFILRGNVVDLAVGIVIGAAFTSVVNAFVSDIITPIIPTGKGTGLTDLTVTIPFTGSMLKIGAFINSAISFLIVAFVIYFFVVRPVNALMGLYKKEAPIVLEVVSTRDCPFCDTAVSLKAMRCPHCTSELPQVKGSEPEVVEQTEVKTTEKTEVEVIYTQPLEAVTALNKPVETPKPPTAEKELEPAATEKLKVKEG